jgi:hypothetical protein
VVLDGARRWTVDEVYEATRPLCGWDRP